MTPRPLLLYMRVGLQADSYPEVEQVQPHAVILRRRQVANAVVKEAGHVEGVPELREKLRADEGAEFGTHSYVDRHGDTSGVRIGQIAQRETKFGADQGIRVEQWKTGTVGKVDRHSYEGDYRLTIIADDRDRRGQTEIAGPYIQDGASHANRADAKVGKGADVIPGGVVEVDRSRITQIAEVEAARNAKRRQELRLSGRGRQKSCEQKGCGEESRNAHVDRFGRSRRDDGPRNFCPLVEFPRAVRSAPPHHFQQRPDA